MTLNTTRLTEAHWRQLPPALRAQLRRRLGGKAGMLNRQVLDIAKALCERGADDLALELYDTLNGQPGATYGCGFGVLWALRERMGAEHGPDPGAMILL